MQRRLSPREMAPPRRRRRDQPRPSSERCRAATDMSVQVSTFFVVKFFLKQRAGPPLGLLPAFVSRPPVFDSSERVRASRRLGHET